MALNFYDTYKMFKDAQKGLEYLLQENMKLFLTNYCSEWLRSKLVIFFFSLQVCTFLYYPDFFHVVLQSFSYFSKFGLINIWVPSVFLSGTGSRTHHVYQVITFFCHLK